MLELGLQDICHLRGQRFLDVEQRHNVRVGLAHDEVVAVEHLAERLTVQYGGQVFLI